MIRNAWKLFVDTIFNCSKKMSKQDIDPFYENYDGCTTLYIQDLKSNKRILRFNDGSVYFESTSDWKYDLIIEPPLQNNYSRKEKTLYTFPISSSMNVVQEYLPDKEVLNFELNISKGQKICLEFCMDEDIQELKETDVNTEAAEFRYIL